MSQRPLSWAKPTKVATHLLSPPITPTKPDCRACTPLALKQSAAHHVGNDPHFNAHEQDSHISVQSQFGKTDKTHPMMLSGQSTTKQEGLLQVSFTGFNAQSIAANCKHTIKWSLVKIVDKIGLEGMKELIINFGTISWKLVGALLLTFRDSINACSLGVWVPWQQRRMEGYLPGRVAQCWFHPPPRASLSGY